MGEKGNPSLSAHSVTYTGCLTKDRTKLAAHKFNIELRYADFGADNKGSVCRTL